MRSAIERAGRGTIALALALAAGAAFAQKRPESVKDPLAGLSAYVPSVHVSGVIRVSGSPQMGELLHLYEEGFRRFQPEVRFEESLKSTVTAVAGVYSGRAEIGLVGREVWPEEVQAFAKAKGHPPLAIEVATGSYDVPKATFALMIFVHASNPVASLSTEQLRRIFANARPASARSLRRAATVSSTLDKGVAAIVAPTLVLAGELDRVVPPTVTLAMAGRIRGADAVLLPAIGHVTAMQAPEVLARHMVRFLNPAGVDA